MRSERRMFDPGSVVKGNGGYVVCGVRPDRSGQNNAKGDGGALAAQGRTKGDAPRSTARSMSRLPGRCGRPRRDGQDRPLGRFDLRGGTAVLHIYDMFYIAAKPRAGAHRQRDAKRDRKPLTSLGPDAKAALNRAKTAARVDEGEVRFVARAALAGLPPDLPPFGRVDRRKADVACRVERHW